MYVYILDTCIYKNLKKSSICQVGKAEESKAGLNALTNSDSKYLAQEVLQSHGLILNFSV